MLVCGDLCSNGEFENEQGLANKLTVAEGTYGTDIYVINGNHDINMSYGADFSGSAVANTKRTQASDFKAVYNRLGYGENVRYYAAAPDSEVKNYGGLSYATEIRVGSTPKKLVKSTALKATFTKAKKTKVSTHVGMRYESSNAVKVVTVKVK